ncbi:MAG: class I SAM-dependent methyltransferase [Acidobacteriota bacterium]
MTDTIANLESLKTRIKATWMAGDYGILAKVIEGADEEFIARRHIIPGARVLDVACGTGNLAIPAAKAGAIVTGVDIATNLLEQARLRATLEGVKIQFDEGDAEGLPYPDGSFDLVVSAFGVMFAPRPELAAAELVRVCRPGGQIALASWTPRGFIGQMFRTMAAHVPPPPGVPPPTLWGDEATVRERLREGIADLGMTPVSIAMKFPLSIPETFEFHLAYLGPMQLAFAALPEDKRPALRQDLENLWGQHNVATDGTTHVEAEYLEVVATRA